MIWENNKIGIYYPYLASGAKWEELKYSIRSLQKYFQQEFIIYVVGDKPNLDIPFIHIPHTRDEGAMDTNTYDAARKLEFFINTPGIPEHFLKMNDDFYFLKPTNSIELEITRYTRTYMEINAGFCSGGENWKAAVLRSVHAVREKGYKGFMTEHHCPELYETEKMREIFRMYNPAVNRLLTSTLYFNTFPYPTYLCDRKTERALFYGDKVDTEYSFSNENIEEKIEDKRFLNHNDMGLSEELKDVIIRRFENPTSLK